MEINGSTRTCGLIGNPVEHTLSPVIHNHLADMLHHNLTYVPFHVEAGKLKEAIKGAYALNLLGLNITVPYKNEVLKYLSGTDELAAGIGAVNTLVRTENGYRGYNTDMLGLYRALLSEGIALKGEQVILLGAGGAARAVAFLCAQKNAERVYLLNRSLDRAQSVADEVNSVFKAKIIVPVELKDYQELPDRRYLAIQATSVGLYPDSDKAVIEEEAFYQKIHTGYDLVYKPAETKFMKLINRAGGQAYNGLKMLLYQGIIAYELWNHVSVTEEQAVELYKILYNKTKIEDTN